MLALGPFILVLELAFLAHRIAESPCLPVWLSSNLPTSLFLLADIPSLGSSYLIFFCSGTPGRHGENTVFRFINIFLTVVEPLLSAMFVLSIKTVSDRQSSIRCFSCIELVGF